MVDSKKRRRYWFMETYGVLYYYMAGTCRVHTCIITEAAVRVVWYAVLLLPYSVFAYIILQMCCTLTKYNINVGHQSDNMR